MKSKLALFALVFIPVVADAQRGTGSTAYQERNYTLTVQPVLLSVPIGVVMLETRLTEANSFAVFGGYGKFDYERNNETVQAKVYGAGFQSRFYAFDRHIDPRVRFGEPHVGLQGLWAHGEGEETDGGFFNTFGDDVWGRGEQFMVGPFAGYKYTLPFGLAAEIQAGLMGGARYSYGGEGNTGASDEGTWGFEWMPIANLGVGWAF
jgi:hypothetical protein